MDIDWEACGAVAVPWESRQREKRKEKREMRNEKREKKTLIRLRVSLLTLGRYLLSLDRSICKRRGTTGFRDFGISGIRHRSEGYFNLDKMKSTGTLEY